MSGHKVRLGDTVRHAKQRGRALKVTRLFSGPWSGERMVGCDFVSAAGLPASEEWYVEDLEIVKRGSADSSRDGSEGGGAP